MLYHCFKFVGEYFYLTYLHVAYFVVDLQISQANLFLPMCKACLVLRLYGPITDIMAIKPFSQTWYERPNLLKSSVMANYIVDPMFSHSSPILSPKIWV